MPKHFHRESLLLVAAALVATLGAGCFGFGHKKAKTEDLSSSAEPDKLLYDRALNDYQHGHYTEARLNLQTLINTYPDSEYLAKAKLAIADSYYKEGGIEGLTQAVAEYKDFITFFPFLDEASYAQMQVAMAHFRMMEKPDRDRTQAELAEQEFQTFLLKYPKSPLVPQAEQQLRDVQEVLAEGDYRVARFYYLKGAYRAAAARLIELTDRYPLYSKSDDALWMLGDIYERAAQVTKNEDEREKWKQDAEKLYAGIVREYPLSHYAGSAKRRLEQAGVKVPAPDPAALAREEEEKKFAKERPGVFHRSLDIFRSGPDVYMAAHAGQPDLNPPGEETAATEILRPGSNEIGGIGTANGQSVTAETVGQAPKNTSTRVPNNSAADTANGSLQTPAAAEGNSGPNTNSTTSTPGATKDTQPSQTGEASPAVSDPNQKAGAGGKKAGKAKGKNESSSKKKKGLRKLIPW